MIDDLKKLIGSKNVLPSAEDIIPYCFDGTAKLKQRPMQSFLPANKTEVAGLSAK